MNIISIAGNIGQDAEVRHTPQGDAVCNFSVADSQGKDKPPIWWRCQLWGKRAESLCQYLTKGAKVTVSGQVTEREYQDKDGTPRKSIDIRVVDVALQGGLQESQPQRPQSSSPQRGTVLTKQPQGSGFDDMSDEIPW